MSSRDTYPAGSVRALLGTAAVSAATRAALQARLDAPAVAVPQFLTAPEFAILGAVCARLLPGLAIDMAGEIDKRLAAGTGDGWRYDALPADGEAYRAGLAGFEHMARQTLGAGFADLAAEQQDAVVLAVQQGSENRFFEELLAEVTEVYFSHPLAQEAIGYAGMADVPGWQRIGLDEREAREPHGS